MKVRVPEGPIGRGSPVARVFAGAVCCQRARGLVGGEGAVDSNIDQDTDREQAREAVGECFRGRWVVEVERLDRAGGELPGVFGVGDQRRCR